MDRREGIKRPTPNPSQEGNIWETFILERDGSVAENDIMRQKRLESLGVHFLRFDDLDVK